MTTFCRAFRFTLLLILVLPVISHAQICFRGHPKPRCAGFTILEFSAATRLNKLNKKAGPSDWSGAYFYWSAGYLHNLGTRSALGGAFKITADSDGYRYGLVLRYRRWLGPKWCWDVAPGVFLGGKDNFTSDVAINYGDWVGLAIGLDALRSAGGETSWEGHAGLRFGTWLGTGRHGRVGVDHRFYMGLGRIIRGNPAQLRIPA